MLVSQSCYRVNLIWPVIYPSLNVYACVHAFNFVCVFFSSVILLCFCLEDFLS